MNTVSNQFTAFVGLQTKVIPAKYIMKTDDDAFVRIDEVLSHLKEKTASGLLYGLISFQSSPHRDEDSKWFVSEEVTSFFRGHCVSMTVIFMQYLNLNKGPLCRNGQKILFHRGHMVQVT